MRPSGSIKQALESIQKADSWVRAALDDEKQYSLWPKAVEQVRNALAEELEPQRKVKT